MRSAHSPAFLMAFLSTLLVLSIGCKSRHGDDAIAKDIQKKIAENPLTKDAPVSVSAQAGKVTLSGKVKSPEVREKIEQIAREEPGTTAVEDQTTALPSAVPPSETAAVPAAAALPDAAAPQPQTSPPPEEPPKSWTLAASAEAAGKAERQAAAEMLRRE